MIEILQDDSLDISGCLVNCSNNGKCSYLANNKIQCSCFLGFTGKACDIDLRACSPKNNKCLNDGLCIEVNNTNGFICNCTQFYIGVYCETKIDLCQDVKCSGHGNCVDLGNRTKCVCFNLYLGEVCQTQSDELVLVKTVITVASLIAIIIVILFYTSFLVLDILKFLLCNHRKKKPKHVQIKLRFIYKP